MRNLIITAALVLAACNVADKSGFADGVDAAQGPTADAGQPDARPRLEPIACEASGIVRRQEADLGGGNVIWAETETWWAPLGPIDVERAPRITAWACDYVCTQPSQCKRECPRLPMEVITAPVGATCSYPQDPPLDRLGDGGCFPAEVVIHRGGMAYVVCGEETRWHPQEGADGSAKTRFTVVYATVE